MDPIPTTFDHELIARIDGLLGVISSPATSNDELLSSSFNLYLELKPSILEVPEDAQHVVPINLTALHNEDFHSLRDDADLELYRVVGGDKSGIEKLCKALSDTLTPSRLSEDREWVDKLQTNLVASLMVLSRSMYKNGSKERIHNSGGINSLCEIVGLQGASRTTLFWVTACIRNVSRRFDSKAEIVEYKHLLSNLLRLLKGFGKAVKAGACSAICNLSWGDLRSQVTVEGAVPKLVEALYSKCEHVVRSAAGALRNLSCTDYIREEISNAGAIPKLVDLLRSDSQQILYWVSAAVKNLAIGSTCVGSMISSGAVPNVMEAIPKAKNAKTFERLCGILRNLASEDSFANQFNESVAKIFFTTMLSHANEKGWDEALESAILFIYHSASMSARNMGTFLQCGSLEILMEMLMKVSWPLKSSVSTIIALFINDRGPIELDITPVVDALLPDILKSTMSDDPQNVRMAVFVVRNLTVEETFSVKLVNGGILPPLLNLLRSNTLTITTMAIRALTNLASHTKIHHVIASSGAFDLLRDMLRLRGPRQNAIRFLWNLCCGGALNEMLIDHGFIPAIVNLLDDRAWTHRDGRGSDTEFDSDEDESEEDDFGPIFGQAQSSCVLMLKTLGETEKGQRALLDAGALPVLAKACKFYRSSMRSSAHRLLVSLLERADMELLTNDFLFEIQSMKSLNVDDSESSGDTTFDSSDSEDACPEFSTIQQVVVNKLIELAEQKNPSLNDDKDLNFGFLLDSEQYSDMLIVVNGTEKIKAHRAIVHGRSRYFRAMFESGLAEWKGSEIHINIGCEAAVFREVIRFIYSDNANITEDNVQSLMELSDQYLLPALTSLCESYLVQNLCVENFVDIAELGKHFRSRAIAISVGVFYCQNADDIMDTVKLDSESLKSLLNFDSGL